MAIGAGGFRRRVGAGVGGGEPGLTVPGQPGSPVGRGCGERLGGHTRVVVSGRRWPQGTGGGEWLPGIWKTQGGGAGSELAARDTEQATVN